MNKEPYYIRYVASLGFVNVPIWLQLAVDEGLVQTNHPELIQDIWDLSWRYEGIPSLTIKKTGEEFRINEGRPIKYEDVYKEAINGN